MSEFEDLVPAKIVISRTPKVLHMRLDSGILVCAFHKGSGVGGAVVLRSGTENALIVQNLLKGVMGLASAPAEQILFKIAATKEDLERIKAQITKLQAPIAGECPKDDRPLDAYFYTDSGRLRVREVQASEAEEKTEPSFASVATARKRILIVDDSRPIRQLLQKIISRDPRLEVVAEAERPSQVEALIQSTKPDVITLDIHMPEMDGVTLLKKIFPKYQIPTIMITSLRMEDGPQVLDALESGAIDYIQKPALDELDVVAPLILEKVFAAANSNRRSRVSIGHGIVDSETFAMNSRVIAIGSSTGGTEALRVFLSILPQNIPPILIVQHIPPVFSTAFARRLASLFPFEVREAEDRDEVKPNRVLIAPGGLHMKVEEKGSQRVVRIVDTPPVNRHKPSVDVLFDSVAEVLGKKAIGVILTGMGQDGARGLLKMKKQGSPTLAQNEETCVVYGMPRAAVEMGAADHVLPLNELPEKIWNLLKRDKAGKIAS